MVTSPRAGKGMSQQLPTRIFVLFGFAAGILISCIIIWGSSPPAENAGAEVGAQAVGPAAALRANKLWSWALSKARRPFVPGSDFSRDGDFVAAYYTEPRRHKLVEAGREWRKEYGIRTVVVSNIEAEAAGVTVGDQYEWDEVWQTWPDIDDQNGTLDINTIAYFKGDHRGAMTPLIAHKELGDSYKWMLYGDDDSVFFPEGVARAVQGLDPSIPYFISDRAWGFGFGDGREYGATPRCVPCNWDAPPGVNESAVPVPPLRGCPCDRIEVCTHWNEHFPGVFPEKCEEEQLGMPVPHHMTFHGGGGTILSIGLLRALNATAWQECVEGMKWRQGSDSYVTKCIWKAGYGMTDPGYSYFTKKPLEHFTFDRWTFRGENVLTMVPAMERKITDFNEEVGFCMPGPPGHNATGCTVPDEVDELFTTMVSVHSLGGSFGAETEKAANAISLTTKVYRDYIDSIAKAHPEVIDLDLLGTGMTE